MIKSIFTLTIVVILFVVIFTHWNETVAFASGCIDWILHGMKSIAAGPSQI